MSDLPPYVRLVRAPNPGPMTLDGTNSWVLGDGEEVVVVDPGPLIEPHLARLAEQGRVKLVLLTHAHPDHAQGVGRLKEITGAPVLARDERLGGPLPRDGAVVKEAGLVIRIVETPGHSADSVSFLVEDDRAPALLTGDTVLGRGTTVVAHPDGRLGDYLTSLRVLRRLVSDRPGIVLLPGHGPQRPDALAALEYYIEHRAERLAQVEAAVAAGATTAQDVVRVVYADVERELWPAAEMSVRAQLDYLASRG